jgi:MYXO-CTERM domain-containing protein
VLTHEIGHFSGLNHSSSAFDTMYYSWRPWPGQRTLSTDDKRGLCSIYPVAADECASSTSCLPDEDCLPFEHGNLCAGTPDPIGAPCSYDRVECTDFCLFTATNLSSGYCSRFCEGNSDCPLTHHCDVASAGGTEVMVCFAGAQPPPDAGVDVDAAATCTVDDQCPSGQHCDVAAGACTLECRTSADCGGGASCDDLGQCVAAPAGCGCQGGPDAGGGGLVLLVIAAGVQRRTSRPRPPRCRAPRRR